VKRKPPDNPAAKAKQAAQRAALNALKRARRTAARGGVELSDWEGEFLGSVEQRIKTYGRAFADPDKGAMGAPLSLMQGLKLKEISAKAAGKEKKPKVRKGFSKAKPNRGEPEGV
jgi:hypothetical protein